MSLTNIDLSNNEIEYDMRIVGDILMNLVNLRCLYMKGNDFIRKFSNYRKNMIVDLLELRYLDDRPVNMDERECCAAFRRGGLAEEREKRAEINNKRI